MRLGNKHLYNPFVYINTQTKYLHKYMYNYNYNMTYRNTHRVGIRITTDALQPS